MITPNPIPDPDNEGLGQYPDVKFPTLIDSTLIAQWKKCHRAAYYESFCRRVAEGTNPHLNAGQAYATGHEVFRKLYYGHKVDKATALRAALRALTLTYGPGEPEGHTQSAQAKTWNRVATAFLTYYEDYPPETDFIIPVFTPGPVDGPLMVPMAEFSFAEPIDIPHPTTGEPILIGGRADCIVHLDRRGWMGDWHHHEGKPKFIYDDKTTHAMGPTWPDQWKLRSQFRCYTWAARRAGHAISGAYIRGAGIQKTQIKHIEVPILYADWQIDEWEEIMRAKVNEMILVWTRMMADNHGDPERMASHFQKDLDGACSMYGGCMFRLLCSVKRHSDWINSGFVERTWSPIDVETL
jgi:hypothetical protein